LATRFLDAESETFPDDSGGPSLAVRRDVDQRDTREFSLGLDLSHEITERLGYRLAGTLLARDEDFSSPGVAPGVRDPFGIPPNATDSRFRRAGLELGATVAPARMLRITGGLDFQHEDGESDSVVEVGGIPVPGEFDLSRSVVGTYVEGRIDTPLGLSVNAGVRLDLPEGFDDEVSGRAGIVYRLPGSGITFKASWSQGFKLPSFFALGNPVVGNPDLGPETSESVEVGLRQTFAAERVVLAATYFRSRFFDLVDLDEGPPPALVNRSRVSIEGVELALSGAVTSRVSARGHLTHADADIKGTSEPLRNRPEWRGGLGVTWVPESGFSASLTGLYVGRVPDSSIPTGAVTLDPYVRFDAALSYRPDPSVTLTFAVDNLLDERYEEAVGFPAPGVTPRVGVRAVF
ncbi:MAG: TonB-dependent receptor, partial [Gammaproteobacteria bacterium]|nr:TonB-dependent receptor [Gammaproteobacteria bacterium]NIR81609.1 TonB-dependent receptor [Gammaproteobacteria bacterium]NIR88160.1 TonB-dependent receptor [Gammaproteobacteria bacterium]NIU02721.1 TonB-dependent receptor [Gammaproteobacteria bacterium]NIV73320.1 TonB-dependent receptor [Gammaproteobacteria bacterium]